MLSWWFEESILKLLYTIELSIDTKSDAFFYMSLLVPLICLPVGAVILLYTFFKLMETPHPNNEYFRKSHFYHDPILDTQRLFPCEWWPEEMKYLSVIVPAYNEGERISKMLDECLEFLDKYTLDADTKFSYEVIIVSDGSKDNTVEQALAYSKKYGSDKVRVLKMPENRGKGAAVKLGMMRSRGRYLLFADADGATKFSDYEILQKRLLAACKSDLNSPAIAIGSRCHLEEEAKAQRSFFRNILMHGFHFLVWLFAVDKIRDTQCGFKLFTRSAAFQIFPLLHIERWAFDVELLYLAQSRKILIEEQAVNWTEIEGSKVTPFWSWLEMGRDLILIWFKYTTGIWRKY